MAAGKRIDQRVCFALTALGATLILAAPLFCSVGEAMMSRAAASGSALWWPSVSVAALAANIALATALLGHWSVYGERKRLLPWTVFAVAVSAALPSYVHALAWGWVVPASWLDQKYGLTACVLGVSYAPACFLVLSVVLRPAPRSLFEAAWAAGLSPLCARALVGLAALPACAAAWLIGFVLSFSDFPVADYFQLPTYATEIFARVAAWLDVGAAGRLALPLLATAVIVALALGRALEATKAPEFSAQPVSSASEPGLHSLRRKAGRVSFALLVAGVPVVLLISHVPSTEVLLKAGRALRAEMLETIVMGFMVGAFASVSAGALAYCSTRRIVVGARSVRLLIWVSFAWPASLLCLGAISLYSALGARLDLPEFLAAVLVLTLRWWVLPYELWLNYWQRLPAALEEACWAVGLSWREAFVRLLRPHGLAALFAAALLTFCFSINDLSVLVLLAPPGFSTTILNIFSAIHYGPSGYVAALSLWQVVLVGVMATLSVVLWRFTAPTGRRHVDC